jgi:hypothetical protein
MSERPPEQTSDGSTKLVDFILYALAAVTYIVASIYNKWLLDWVIGPLWLVAWVWGVPALWRLLHGQPVRPNRGPRHEVGGDEA